MEAIPRKYGEWSQFDRYCKLVLYHEAIDYLREMKCRRDREAFLKSHLLYGRTGRLPPQESL